MLEEKKNKEELEEKEEQEKEEPQEQADVVAEETEEPQEQVEEVAEETEEKTAEPEQESKEEEGEPEDFEKLLEESLGNIHNFEIGDEVEGEIINITDSYIFVSLGGKRDVYAEKTEYLDKKGNLPYKIGDKLSGYVVKCSETETMIAKSLMAVNKRIVEEAFEEKIPVSGKIQSVTKGGYIVDLSGLRAFCPASHMGDKPNTDVKEYLGQNYDFQIIEYSDKGRNIVLSRRVLLEKEREQQKKETLENIEVGSVVKGKITRLTNFGVFIDIGGVEGLLHISELSWTHVESPSDVVNLGDEIEAKVIRMNKGKVSLSLKAMQPDPFYEAIKDLNEGDVVTCKVLRNLPFGSFVEIKPTVEGLIPISEMAAGRHISHPSEIIQEGDTLEAQLLKINAEKKKISLSLKALQPDPWDTIEEHFSESDVVKGTVENVVNFGAFIKVKDGIVGLMPKQKINLAGIKLTPDSVGEEINVRISKIDKEQRRISLEPSSLPETVTEQKGDWKSYKNSKKKELDEDNPFSIL